VAIHSIQSEAISRGARMLRTAFGPAIARFLDDSDIVEVMLNPDGRLWIDRLSSGLADTGQCLAVSDGERIVRLVAHHVGAKVHAGSPRVSAELPETGTASRGYYRQWLRRKPLRSELRYSSQTAGDRGSSDSSIQLPSGSRIIDIRATFPSVTGARPRTPLFRGSLWMVSISTICRVM
jgi:hypothetical protein